MTEPLIDYMTTASPVARDAAWLRLYAQKVRDDTARGWEISSVVAAVLDGIATRLVEPTPDVLVAALQQLQQEMHAFAHTRPSSQQTRRKSAREMVELFESKLAALLTAWTQQEP